MNVKLGERSIGQHGSNVYYKEFSVRTAGGVKHYRLGKFYFVQKSCNYPVTIAEFQLIWQNVVSHRKFASVKLYFKPEIEYEDYNDQEEDYGKDEVVEATKQVVIECSKLPSWECSYKNWYTSIGEPLYQNADVQRIQKLLGKVVPSSNDGKLDIKILSFPQYCRYKTCLKLLQAGVPKTYHELLACGGLDIKNLNTIVLFSRRQFEHEDIEDLSLTENVKVPVFKGRPRKRKKHEPPSNSKKAKIMQPSLLKKVEVHEEKTNPKMSASVLTKKNHHKDLMGIKPKQIRGKDTVTKKSIENDEEREIKDQFSKDLHKFMEDKGMPIIKIPSIGCAQVEPLTLYNAVKHHGGYGQVTLNRLWRNVYDCLGHSTMITNAATGTRKIYEKLLLPYEKYQRAKVKEKEKMKVDSNTNKMKVDSNTNKIVKPAAQPESVMKEGQPISSPVRNHSLPINNKQRGRTSTKFNNQIEKLRNKQSRKLEEAFMHNKTARTVSKKPPWVNELNVDIVNARRKSEVHAVPNILEKRPDRISVDEDLISPRRPEPHSPTKKIPHSIYSPKRDAQHSSKSNAVSSSLQPKPQHLTREKQHVAGNLCEFKIQSVRSLATPERHSLPKSTQYLHYPFPSSYQYAPPASRQYYTLNEANTLIPITQSYGPSFQFREMRNFRNEAESSSYKIKSSALKNHEPYIIHHPTHLHRAYHSELPSSHYPVIYTHHPRYVTKSPGNEIPPESRHIIHGQHKPRYVSTSLNRSASTNYGETVQARPRNVDNKAAGVPVRHAVEGYPTVCVVTDPMHVLPKHKWSTSVSCNM